MLDEIVDYVKFLRLQVKVILLLHYETSACHFSTNPGFLDDVMLYCLKRMFEIFLSCLRSGVGSLTKSSNNCHFNFLHFHLIKFLFFS